MLAVMPLVQGIYTAVAPHGVGGLMLRGLFAAICLIPPTVMMGATLPAVARWVETTPRGVSWLGYFYGGNTIGAVFGCLLAGFYLLRVHDMPTATFVAVALNLAVAGAAYPLARIEPRTTPVARPTAADASAPAALPPDARLIYLAIGLSGMSALGAEVVWTRLFSLLLSGTTYTFSIILAVFLIGIGLGSGAGAFIARRTENARRALGITQLLLVAAIAWTSWNITTSLPWWPINPRLSSNAVDPVPDRSGPLPVGDPPRRLPVGRQLPARARGGGVEGTGRRRGRRARLRRQHRRRDRRRGLDQPGVRRLGRHAERASGS